MANDDPGHCETEVNSRLKAFLRLLLSVNGLSLLFLIGVTFALVATPIGDWDPLESDWESPSIVPVDVFTALTGWNYLPSARVLQSFNTFKGFKNDGDCLLVVETTPQQIRQWLAADSETGWKPTPIDEETAQWLHGLGRHSGTFWRATKVYESDADWHRGHVVILNPDSGTVWIYAWKI